MITLLRGIQKAYLRSRPSASMVNKMENLLSTVNIGRLGEEECVLRKLAM